MFGSGFALFLAGSFFERIQSITGPGGIGIVLKAAGEDVAKALAALKEAIQKQERRLDYANRRTTALTKRVAALETAVPQPGPEVSEDLALAAQEAAEAESALEQLPSIDDDLAAAQAAQDQLRAHLDLLP